MGIMKTLYLTCALLLVGLIAWCVNHHYTAQAIICGMLFLMIGFALFVEELFHTPQGDIALNPRVITMARRQLEKPVLHDDDLDDIISALCSQEEEFRADNGDLESGIGFNLASAISALKTYRSSHDTGDRMRAKLKAKECIWMVEKLLNDGK